MEAILTVLFFFICLFFLLFERIVRGWGAMMKKLMSILCVESQCDVIYKQVQSLFFLPTFDIIFSTKVPGRKWRKKFLINHLPGISHFSFVSFDPF